MLKVTLHKIMLKATLKCVLLFYHTVELASVVIKTMLVKTKMSPILTKSRTRPRQVIAKTKMRSTVLTVSGPRQDQESQVINKTHKMITNN